MIHTWKPQLVSIVINAGIFVGISFVVILPLFFLFGTLVGEPSIWQKMVWYTIFPLAALPWSGTELSILGCLLSNAIAWGIAIQIIIRLSSSKRFLSRS